MADDSVTVNGFVRDIDTPEVIKPTKLSNVEATWNGNGEIESNKTSHVPSSESIPPESVPPEVITLPSPVDIPFEEDEEEFKEVERNGPDEILPTEKFWTSNPRGRVKLRDLEGNLKAQPAISIPGLLHKTATKFPERVALSYKDSLGKYVDIKYKEYEENVRIVAKAFIKLGLEKYKSVGIIGFNSVEWFYSNLAAIYAGGFAAGIYTTNSADACFYCLDSGEANICVVEDEKQLQKILEIKHKLPNLKAIIQYCGEPKQSGVLSWADVMRIGKEESDEKLNNALKSIAINECCTLVYTSGTEGRPKAVMLSHDNLTWDSSAILTAFKLSPENIEVVVSYLPLSHVAAQVTDMYCPLHIGAKVVFADKDALKGSLKNTMVEVRPTIFMGVPRVWEKMYETLMSISKATTGFKKTLATWAKMASLHHHENCIANGCKSEPYKYRFYRWLIFDRIKQRMGLDRCKLFISAAAPISSDIRTYFMSIDLLLMEAFGMSECAGAHSVGNYDVFSLSSVGQTLPGAETKLDMKDEQGEICLRGRHVFMGYLNDPAKTNQAMDEEGWLHSGDIGKIDENGNIYITGRSKELLITAGGENVAPVLIEQTIKTELPVVSNAVLIGDKRKFLSVLLTLKTEADSEGKPTDRLIKDVREWCESLFEGPCETLTDILDVPERKKKVFEAIQDGINRANKKAISRAQNVQKFAILPTDFSVGEELGPTLKMKRDVVYDKYADVIEEFYAETNTEN